MITINFISLDIIDFWLLNILDFGSLDVLDFGSLDIIDFNIIFLIVVEDFDNRYLLKWINCKTIFCKKFFWIIIFCRDISIIDIIL